MHCLGLIFSWYTSGWVGIYGVHTLVVAFYLWRHDSFYPCWFICGFYNITIISISISLSQLINHLHCWNAGKKISNFIGSLQKNAFVGPPGKDLALKLYQFLLRYRSTPVIPLASHRRSWFSNAQSGHSSISSTAEQVITKQQAMKERYDGSTREGTFAPEAKCTRSWQSVHKAVLFLFSLMYAFLMYGVFTWKKFDNLLWFSSVFEYSSPGFRTHE